MSHYTKQCQKIVEDYRRAGGAWPARTIDIAEWAISHERWDLPREGRLRVCADDLAEAMRQESFIDEFGRKVRAKHPAKIKIKVDGQQQTFSFWDDIRTVEPKFFHSSAGRRRNGIVAECVQFDNDVGFFNRLHPDPNDQYVLVLDFTKDVEEAKQPKGPPRKKATPQSSTSSNESRRPRGKRGSVQTPTASVLSFSRPSDRPSDPA